MYALIFYIPFLKGQSTACAFDYLREASIVGGWDMTIRSGPTSEAKLISVGEQPMVALYRISKVSQLKSNSSRIVCLFIILYLFVCVSL